LVSSKQQGESLRII